VAKNQTPHRRPAKQRHGQHVGYERASHLVPQRIADLTWAIENSLGYVSRITHLMGLSRWGVQLNLHRYNLWPLLDQVREEEQRRRARILGPKEEDQ
jgi:hypothetical protein